MTTIYGPVITGKDIREAVKATIGRWCTVYTEEIGRQKGETLPRIRTYGQAIGTLSDGTVADELPACIIVAPGTIGDPRLAGDGDYSAVWGVGVGIVVADTTADRAVRVAEVYTAALRTLMLQHGSLDGFARSTAWFDEEVVPIAYERDRVIAAGSLQFEITIDSIVNRYAGPPTPPADPTQGIDTGTVTHTHVDVGRLP